MRRGWDIHESMIPLCQLVGYLVGGMDGNRLHVRTTGITLCCSERDAQLWRREDNGLRLDRRRLNKDGAPALINFR